MKAFALLLFSFTATSVLSAQDLTVDVHDPSGAVADTTVSSPYQFPDTAVGGGSGVVMRIRDHAGFPVQIVAVVASSSTSSATANPNFSINGNSAAKILSTSNSSVDDITVNFVPLSQAALTGYLQIYYQVQKNNCSFTATDTTACPSQVLTATTLQGNGIAPSLVLTYPGTSGPVLLQPNNTAPLNFGNVSTSASASITFTLTNQTALPVTTPTVALSTQQFNSSAFALNASALPASIPAGGTGSFTITFAPGQVGLTTATFTVGSLPYPIEGAGIVVADIDALQIWCVDSDGVRTLPQAATPIGFGQVVAGTNAPNTLNFTVTNPSTSWNAVSLQTLAVTGTAFTLTSAPAAPVTIAPGASITFSIVFAPTTKGNYTGTLAIGTRLFSLSGSSISSALPDATLSVDINPLTSGQQAHLSIQLAAASTVSAIGQLSMSFTPSVSNVTDDPAILFLATNGRNLQVNVAAGGQSAAYNGQSSIGFQTGTTAGTLTFTLTFPNKAPITQSFTIAPEKISITNASAVRQSPNLVVTLTGFDNTYSAGKLSFTFYGTNGSVLTQTALSVDATSAFSQYFATSTVGSAFSVQASFPVNGDVTQIGSVAVQMTNAAGTASATENFQ
jgi:hypothetical protein